jgi:hypothetical protein
VVSIGTDRPGRKAVGLPFLKIARQHPDIGRTRFARFIGAMMMTISLASVGCPINGPSLPSWATSKTRVSLDVGGAPEDAIRRRSLMEACRKIQLSISY